LEKVQTAMRVLKLVKLYRLWNFRGHHGWVTDGQTDRQTYSYTDINMVTWVHTQINMHYALPTSFRRERNF